MARYNNRGEAKRYSKELGRRIKARLGQLDMTQMELSRRSGIDQSCISRYIRGEEMPMTMLVVKIARALSMDVSDLIDF